jgi:putative component of membrane protein insertase Oxa1/YidC/SpoIIIJ protein YidD
VNLFLGKDATIYFCLSFILACLLCSPCSTDAAETQKDETATVLDFNPFVFPIKFFRQYLSGADGDRCSMYPSCSRCALDAVKKHGGIIGWIMTCDRLMRCGRDEVNHSPFIRHRHRMFTYDPVENNDFWWE